MEFRIDYTPDEEQKVIDYFQEGEAIPYISNKMELSENSVRYILRCNNFNLPNKRRIRTIGSYKKYNGTHLHRYLMEIELGRKLTRQEHVHHIDFDIDNNAISNLIVLTQNEHKSAEWTFYRIMKKFILENKVKFNRETKEYEIE